MKKVDEQNEDDDDVLGLLATQRAKAQKLKERPPVKVSKEPTK
jgi:hypothetical protein